uniref:MADF domain-containing protein n=1 Tax=Anopheles dirus TaxID=7168 RepID=A0A182NV88_9DIPT
MEEKRTNKRRSVEMSLEETFHLISEVQLRRCLWDPTHEDHRCRKTRDESWQDMSLGMNYDADDLLEKWQSLRSSYRQYKSQMRKRARQSVSGRIRVVKWPFYSAMSFTNTSKDEEEMPVLSTAASPKSPVKAPIKSPRQTEPEFEQVEVDSLSPESPLETTDCLLNPQDEDVMYGQSIALQMKQFSPRTKRKLQIHIHDLIADAQKESFAKQFGHSYDG